MWTPLTIASQEGKSFPGIWEFVDALRQKGRDLWPESVFMPSCMLMWAIEDGIIPAPRVPHRANYGLTGDAEGRNKLEWCRSIAMLAAWRTTQGVYRIDPALEQHLCATPVAGSFPAAVLQRLPEWAVYVPFSLFPGARGFLAMLDCRETRLPEPDGLMLWFIEEDGVIAQTWVPLAGTAENFVQKLMGWMGDWHRDGMRPPPPDMERKLHSALNLLFYLCSEGCELRERTTGAERAERPAPKTTKGKERFFPPKQIREWDVGWRIGPALRTADEDLERQEAAAGDQQRPRPHVRRAHWHHYWTGRRTADQPGERLVLKWVPPALVNVAAPEDLVPTVRPVR